MLPLISKYKLYLYLFFLIFLSSIFNFKFFENYQDKFSLKNIHINGVSYKEKINIEEELYKLKNTNIFKINEDKVLKKLAKFNFIEDIHVKKNYTFVNKYKFIKNIYTWKNLCKWRRVLHW